MLVLLHQQGVSFLHSFPLSLSPLPSAWPVNCMANQGPETSLTPKGSADSIKRSLLGVRAVLLTGLVISSRRVIASDEIDVDVNQAKTFVQSLSDSRGLASDEFTIDFTSESLNLRFAEEGYKGFPIVTVQGILDTNLVVRRVFFSLFFFFTTNISQFPPDFFAWPYLPLHPFAIAQVGHPELRIGAVIIQVSR